MEFKFMNYMKDGYKNQLAFIGGAALLATLAYWFIFRKKDVSQGSLVTAQDKRGQTLSAVEIQGLANSIESAGFSTLGTDEEAIFGSFEQLGNRADLMALIEAFGEHRLEYSFYDAGLSGFLRSELSESEMERVNEILTRKKIDFKF